jgi:PII-like signaling protein
MKLPYESQLLRVFIDETDHYHGKPLYKAIVEKAREMGMAGATVLHGVMGYGAHSRMHTATLLRLSENLPVVIEIVDKPDRIDAFLPVLDEMVDEGLVTLENVKVIAYRHGQAGSQDGRPQT